MFNARGSGVDTASGVRFGGALAGIIFENCAIGSKDTFSFVNEESSIFGVNDIFFPRATSRKERRMLSTTLMRSRSFVSDFFTQEEGVTR